MVACEFLNLFADTNSPRVSPPRADASRRPATAVCGAFSCFQGRALAGCRWPHKTNSHIYHILLFVMDFGLTLALIEIYIFVFGFNFENCFHLKI